MRTDFYRTIPKSARKQDKELMRSGRMRPTVKPDIDNLAKTVLDALLGVAYDDDNQVAELECKKFYSDEPRTEIFIEVVS